LRKSGRDILVCWCAGGCAGAVGEEHGLCLDGLEKKNVCDEKQGKNASLQWNPPWMKNSLSVKARLG
jgi:hypothetical protein